MKFNVRMVNMKGLLGLGIGPTEIPIREVDVPNYVETETVAELLDKIWYWGQNDFQPVEKRCSVSVGDVIDLPPGLFLVAARGFSPITEEDYQDYAGLGPRGRTLFAHSQQGD